MGAAASSDRGVTARRDAGSAEHCRAFFVLSAGGLARVTRQEWSVDQKRGDAADPFGGGLGARPERTTVAAWASPLAGGSAVLAACASGVHAAAETRSFQDRRLARFRGGGIAAVYVPVPGPALG